MNHYNKNNLTEKTNDSILEDNKKNINNNNNLSNFFSLYNNFFIKENRMCHSSKKSYINKSREVLPKYSNIETSIDSDKNKIKNYFLLDPNFKDLIEKNSSIFTFKTGFRKLFFGPKGLVTKKNAALRKYYKSLLPKKVDFNQKVYIGSMELYDSLGQASTYNKRLKLNQKKIIEINGNFDMSSPSVMKMKRTYHNFSKKWGLSSKNIKNKSFKENIKSEKNRIKENKRFSLFSKAHNLFLDYKNNLIQDNTTKSSLTKGRKYTKQFTDINHLNHKMLMNKLINISERKNYSQEKKISNTPNILPIPNKDIFLKTFDNSSNKINESIKNIKKEILKTENNINKKKTIENYNTKSMNFVQYFKQRKDFQKYINSYKKAFNKKIFYSNYSNNKIRDSLNNFKFNNEKYVIKTNKYFKKKIEEPYNEFKEDSKNVEHFNDFAKNVDFSNMAFVSKGKRGDKINTNSMAYSYKIGLDANLPVKEFIKKFKRKKEKEKENKILKSVRVNFNMNSKIIHNLTISLDDIKKKYNY